MDQQALDFTGNTPISAYDRMMSPERNLGAVMAAKAAQRCAPDFVPRAKAFVISYLAQHGPTPGEILTDMCKLAGIVATNDKAFGAVFGPLAKAGTIRTIAYCERRKGRGTAGGRIWALAL